MKVFLLTGVASLATAFVVPSQEILATFVREELDIHDASPQGVEGQDNLPPQWQEAALFAENFRRIAWEQQYAADNEVEFLDMIESVRRPAEEQGLYKLGLWRAIPRKLMGFFYPAYYQTASSKCHRTGVDEFDVDDLDHPGHRPPHHPHHPHHPPHKEPTKTIYELLSESNHSKIFSHVIDQYDHVKKYLNSTEFNYTVYVPTDRAFKRFKGHPKPPKEAIAKWLAYHVSPGVHSSRSFSASLQTVPTYLHQENNGTNHQRIRVQRGLFKHISLNFFSKVIKSDIPATNGIIHAIDHFLVPPFSALDTIDFLTEELSTLNLGLTKTGLVKGFDASHPKTGATIFAPTNHAFKRLGPKINAFLFSRYGEKYLKALLQYHLVTNHTLFTDAYYPPESEEQLSTTSQYHVDLPTNLGDHHLSVDIYNWHGVIAAYVNGASKVGVPNLPVKEGVIHLVQSVLIPPKKPGKKELPELGSLPANEEHDEGEEISVEELIERLEPFVES